MSVKLPFAGGCVCGAVRYEVTAAKIKSSPHHRNPPS